MKTKAIVMLAALLPCLAWAQTQNLSGGTDVTGYLVNPNFNGSVSGWTVVVPGGQNVGYQGVSYSNGSVTISQFAEAWIPTPGTLGAGRISQKVYGLSDGIYRLEADVIACNQATSMMAEGVSLFAESDFLYEQSVGAFSGKPVHFSCDFILSGDALTLGLQTSSQTTANWVAFDNVRLTYYGTAQSPATGVSVSASALQLVAGETRALTASVLGITDAVYDHVSWTSSDEQICKVDASGRVTALHTGTAYVYATAAASSVRGAVAVTVEKSDVSQLTVNEIQVANIDMFIDPSVNYGGWVEFYNGGSSSANLAGLYVSNDPADLTKFRLPDDAGIVPAGGFATIWFDHHDTGTAYSDEAYKQVPFKLTYEGGTLYVSDSDGTLLQQAYPAALPRTSYARTSDGGSTWGITSTPTPASTNAGSSFASQQLAAPVVDKDATVYTSAFTLTVGIPSGCTLRYTTDGSTPTLSNGQTSTTGRFSVSGSTNVFRFRLFRDGYLPSEVVTRTYIYKDKAYYLPIVSVVTDSRNLYDATIGAYTDGSNGTSGNNKSFSNKNRSWERPVNFEYLVPDDGGSFMMALNQECDFEVCGGWSRHFDPASSFRLKGGKYYLGQNFLPYPFFKDKPYIKNKTIVLRNGGNDNYGRLRDAAIHAIILRSGFYMDCQAAQPAHVFINGKYCFMFNVREPNNKNHGYSNYGIDTDEMDQFEINGSVGYEQKTGDDRVFRQWMALAEQLAGNPSDAIYGQICELVDIDEYVNYMAAECYVGCSDWLTNSNNVKGFRSRADGKFHLVFMDLDAGFSSTNMIAQLASRRYDSRYDTGKNFLIDIFLNMLKYAPFAKRFIDAFSIVDGSVFEATRTRTIVNAMRDEAYTAMGFEGHSGNISNSASSLINAIGNGHASRLNNLRNYFDISKEYTAQLSADIAGAALFINQEEIPTGRFDGRLFGPAVVRAKAPAGYRFKGWVSSGTSVVVGSETLFGIGDSWQYYDQGSLDGRNWKDLSYNTSGWSTGAGPFGYGNVGINGSKDYATTLSYGSSSSNKRPTYYLRKVVTLDSAPTASDLYQLTTYVDDGYVVYVNGTEVGRHLLDGTPSYSTYTSTYVGATAATAILTIDNSLLRKGQNIIAVEVHNCSATSSDIYWAASMTHGQLGQDVIVSTDEQLDVATLGSSSLALVATFERLADDQLLADIATPIRVNEVSAGNTIFINDAFKKNDWLELYNTTDTDLDAAGLYVSDDLADPLKYQIPSSAALNTVIPAHGHLIVWADKLEATTQLHAPFKLGNADGQMVLVSSSGDFASANASFVAEHPALRDFADGLAYDTHRGDQSVGRYPDGANTFYQMNRPTIERQNSLRSYDVATGEDTGIMATTDATVTLDLAQGWNWVSHPLATPVSVNLFKDHADRILGQTLEAYYSSDSHAMAGPLTSLKAGELYKFDMDEAHSYELRGLLPATPAPVSLRAGWNWIGCPLTSAQPLSKAFGDSLLEDGDILMGQSGFSVYSSTDGWVGTLSSVVPGSGYLYRSVSTKSVRFQPDGTSLRLRRPLHEAAAGRYGLDRHAYPNVMGIIARLRATDQPIDLSTMPLTLTAFDAEGRCRGVGEAVDGQVFMTLYGHDGERLTFQASYADGTSFPVQEHFAFASDVLGSRQAPVWLTIGAELSTDIEATDTALAADAPVGYYSLSGLFAGSRAAHLRPGIYVVRLADGRLRKLLVQ